MKPTDILLFIIGLLGMAIFLLLAFGGRLRMDYEINYAKAHKDKGECFIHAEMHDGHLEMEVGGETMALIYTMMMAAKGLSEDCDFSFEYILQAEKELHDGLPEVMR